MNDYRAIFAVLSAAAGLVMLIVAARYSFSKKPEVFRRKRVITSLIYGVLFLIAGGVLWSRHGEVIVSDEQQPPPVAKQITPEPQPQVTQQSAPSKPDTSQHRQVAEVKKPEVVKPAPATPTQTAESAPTAMSPSHYVSAQPNPVVINLSEANKTPVNLKADKPPKEPEARIAWVVTHTFSAIEAFFDRYASPSHVSNRSVATAHADGIRFPQITFAEQSADLSPESEIGLRTLAKELLNNPGVNLEIQARVDSVGPEALNYMLTQARAAAVRDFLVVEGVPAERLMARGFGTQQFPHGNDTLIAFVVRR